MFLVPFMGGSVYGVTLFRLWAVGSQPVIELADLEFDMHLKVCSLLLLGLWMKIIFKVVTK